MTGQTADWKTIGRRTAAWLLIAACFVGVPAMLIGTAVHRYCQLGEHERAKETKLNLQQVLNEATLGVNIESYIAQLADRQFKHFDDSNASDSEVAAWLENERKTFENRFDYRIWDHKGKTLAHNLTGDIHSPEWHEVFIELRQSCHSGRSNNSPVRLQKQVETDLAKVRQIIGPQYVKRMAEDSAHPKILAFGWPDSAFNSPLFWTNFYKKRLYLLLFDPAIIRSDIGIKRQIDNFARNRPQNFGIFRPAADIAGMWSTREKSEKLLAQLKQMTADNLTFIETTEQFLATAFLTPEISIFATVEKHYSLRQLLLYPLTVMLLFVLLMMPFLVYTWRITIGGQPGSISIRPRIAFIFFFASAIPFIAISIFAREHYSQKHDASLKETHRRSMALLQNYDERMQSMWSRVEHKIRSYLDEWAKEMHGREIDQENNRLLTIACRELLVESYFIIASSSTIAGSFSGPEHLNETLEQKPSDIPREEYDESGNRVYRKTDTQNAQIANIIGKRIMSELNGELRSTKEADRLELLFESLMQKSFSEITHSFIKAMSGLSPWGFGRTLNLAMLKFMSAGNQEKIDFMALMIWSSPAVQEAYLLKTIDEINRNPLGLKVIACNHFSGKFHPSVDRVPDKLADYLNRIVEQPSEEIEIVELNGQEYMVVGFIGKHLSRYKIVGLYPIERLDKMIAGQRTDLFLFALFCLILAAWLAQILSRSFLNPLNSLQEAATAIEKRHFDYRVGDLGKDEFGETAAIFDEVMIGLEELEVAKVVQESLFPSGTLQQGGFAVYGKSLAMAELGGDYFDYFGIDDDHMAVLLGDVAGHGVGAALIMAMAKAGIVKSRDHAGSPVKLLERLHELIYSSKTKKQKKIMTFQYLTADSRSGRAVYSNAGGCSPIFCSGGQTEEISLSGAALGSFKKAKLQEREITFKPGDFMVFYTDGIIEARNREGVEFGYENFARLVAESAEKNPEVIYSRICAGYDRHITGMEAQDDLTLVVICYN